MAETFEVLVCTNDLVCSYEKQLIDWQLIKLQFRYVINSLIFWVTFTVGQIKIIVLLET